MEKELSYKVKGKIVSSIEKILSEKEPKTVKNRSYMMKNEKMSFQLAFFNDAHARKHNTLTVSGTLAPYVTLRSVENVPVTYTAPEADDYYIGKTAGLYPDVLKPLGKMGVVLPCRQWKGIWVSIENKDGLPVGKHTLSFTLTSEENEVLNTLTYQLEVLDICAEQNSLVMTNWMHYDCICQWHKVKPFTNRFYNIFEKYLEAYVHLGFTMLLVPIFTPPLDTEYGAERMTTQLVQIEVVDGEYKFDFSLLREFIRFAKEKGIRYFEFGHLFTQWGGKFCPKIVAKKNGKMQKIFGWHVHSTSAEYVAFLDAFLPRLHQEILAMGIKEASYLHLTDEPNKSHTESYTKCCEIVKKHMQGIPILDALSETVFYEKGLVDVPVISIEHYDGFVPLAIKNLFVYCCCYPDHGYYSNRFINMPGLRTRILGMQLYRTGVQGFLHWGFNFYNSVLSIQPIDPYTVTDAGGFFPGGDGFIVYPTANGVYYSIRAELSKEAMQDYNALLTLEKLAGKAVVRTLLDGANVKGYNVYPRKDKDFIALRNKIYKEIKACLRN
ncbi:MAG: DUF4091 domain-containing protein [Clostridia bacterium]|nr:DUF4091 domain-containing protein [Clostridia bacterium]